MSNQKNISEKMFIELYNAGKDSMELAELFKVGERTIQTYEQRLRKQGKIKYRKEFAPTKKEKTHFKQQEIFEEVKVYLDNANSALVKYQDFYKNIHLKSTFKNSKQTEDLALVWSDMHTGMINFHPLTKKVTYNQSIQEQELKNLLRGVLRFQQLYKSSYNLETLYIFDAGDNITNDRIFDGQMMEITCGVGEQIIKTLNYQSNFIRKALETFPRIVIMKVPGNHGRCFDKETELLTINGYKKYQEIFKGELVATVNLDKNKIEWQPIEDIVVFQNESTMCQAITKTANIKVTPDHSMIVYDRNNNKYKRVFAKTLWNQMKGITIPVTFPSQKKDYSISDDYIKLLAWLMTDGSVQTKGGYFNYYIWQSKENFVAEIEKLLNKLKIEYTVSVRKRKIKTICGKNIQSCKPQYMFSFGAKSSKRIRKILVLTDKYILPQWTSNLSDRQVQIFLTELIKGDGTIKKSKICTGGYFHKEAYTLFGTYKILNQLQGLFITHNIACSITEQRTRPGDFYLTIRQSKNIEIDRNKEIVKYNDISWCVTVKNHSLLLRRNGKPFIAGNTTSKPMSEDASNSFEYLLGQLLIERFRDNKRVEIIVPNSYTHTATIHNHKYLLTHGNIIRGATLNSIERAVKDIASLSYEEFYDLVVIGHFHTSLKLRITPKTNLLVNGCFINYDDYAYNKLHKFSSATQYLFNISKKSAMHNLQEISLLWE